MILSIQYLRAIASILVVLSHIAWKNIQAGGSTMHWWHEAGTFGVDIFFIISGFIMIYITANMHQQPNGVRIFLKKRFTRIVPLYWFYTLIALSIFFLMPEKVNSAGGDTQILKSFFLLPLKSEEDYLVGVGWTLHYEFLFYILFSFGLLLTRKMGNIMVSIFLLFSICYALFISMQDINYIFYSFLNVIFIEFLLGMLLYHLLRKIPVIHWSISILSIMVGIFLFSYFFNDHTLTSVHRIDTAISAFLICFGVVSLEYIWKVKEFKLLSKIGDASYSIYLLHPFVLVAMVMLNEKLKEVLPQSEYFLIILMFVVSLISGYISHIWIEKPLIKITKKLFG